MKKFFKEFCLRGMTAAWGGPIILAIIYGILGLTGVVVTLDVNQVVLGVVTSTLMAFVAAGITAVYQVEKLPLMHAIVLNGVVLYIDYLGIYLLNGWLADGIGPLLIFTAIFVVGYAIVWLIVASIIKHNANKLNQKLNTKQ
ncbi:MAG: DUF3021 domain-containing protein [Clostridia bacterium]|nr:DUF3021 domain-containing protein [Clostridia bacterium]